MVKVSRTEICVLCGVNQDLLQIAVRVVTDFDLIAIAPEFWVNAVKAVINADVGKGFINGSGDAFHEEGKSGVHVNVPDNGKPFVVTLLWRLIGFRMYPFVIDDGKISGESPVEDVKGDDIAGVYFCFELSLACAEETFHQSAGSWVMWRSVHEVNAYIATGCAQGVGNVDLGIVEVEFFW